MAIDMQRDFLETGGFGEALGNNVSRPHKIVPPCMALLQGLRVAGVPIIHTREGHRPDLSDAPRAKIERGKPLGYLMIAGVLIARDRLLSAPQDSQQVAPTDAQVAAAE